LEGTPKKILLDVREVNEETGHGTAKCIIGTLSMRGIPNKGIPNLT